MPSYEDPYDELNERRRCVVLSRVALLPLTPVIFCRLITLYQTLHDNIHAKSGQEGTLKLQYIRTEKESVLGWVSLLPTLFICITR